MNQEKRPVDNACVRVAPKIKAHLDGELGPEESRAVQEHLAVCGSCRECSDAFAEIARLLDRAAGGIEPRPPFAVLRERLVVRRREFDRERTVLVRSLKRVAAAAAVVLVTASVLLSWGGVANSPDRRDELAVHRDNVMEIVFSEPVWGSY